MKILFIDTCHSVLYQSLSNDGHNCVEGYDFTLEKIIQEMMDTDGIVIRSRFVIDKNILEKADKLKFIARAGAGMESIDVEYAKSKNIICLNSPEGNRDAVGEHAIGMMLSLMNNLTRADRQVRNNEWIREGNRGNELQGKTIGIIGYGNTGSSFAAKLAGFECNILAYDKFKKGYGNSFVKECSMQEMFDAADILSIHVPLTKETEYFIDDKFINRFKKKIYFINTARGKCVKTNDLVSNLKSGKVIGTCLDVFEYEDMSFEKISKKDNFIENPSWKYLINSDKVILSPHIAGWTFESHEKIARVLYGKIVSVIG